MTTAPIPDLLSQLNGGQSTSEPTSVPRPPMGVGQQPTSPQSPSGDVLSKLNSPIPTSRPSSSDEFDAAQKAGGYSEPSERNGNPVTYLLQKPDESYPDFMKRAVAHGKTVTDEQMKDEAYQPKKIVDAAVVRPAEIAGASAVGMTALNEIATAASMAPEALEGVKNFALKKLAEESPELFGHEAVKATLKKIALATMTRAVQGTAIGGGIALGHKVLGGIWDELFGTGKAGK